MRRMETAQTNETVNVLERLVETLENGRRGFGEAAHKLARNGREDLAPTMRRLSEQRARMANELRDAIGSGERNGGSLSGAAHRIWMGIHDALTGDDPNAVLAAAEASEDHAVEQYRRAVSADLSEEVRGLVERQVAYVKTAHDKVKALRDSNA